MVIVLKYVREVVDKSKREFYDLYVEGFQEFIHEVKLNLERGNSVWRLEKLKSLRRHAIMLIHQ